MNWTERPFAGLIPLHVCHERGIQGVVRDAADDQRAVGIQEARLIHAAGDVPRRGQLDPLFAVRKDGIAFPERAWWGERVENKWGDQNQDSRTDHRPQWGLSGGVSVAQSYLLARCVSHEVHRASPHCTSETTSCVV